MYLSNEKNLNIQAFTDNQKREAYERQNDICPTCNTRFEYEQMEGDYITPWQSGGKIMFDNCQLLCKYCNRRKLGK